MRTVIITVGTSLLANQAAEEQPPRPWSGWRLGTPLPDQILAAPYLTVALPSTVSAEANSLARLPIHSTDRLVWLASDTPEGRWCAEALHAHYGALGTMSEVRVLGGLGYHHGPFAEQGLRALLTTVCDVVREAGGPGAAVFLATGGFKAEIAHLTLAGLILGIDVYYVYQQFDEMIILPRLPLTWDIGWVAQRRSFFEWIDQEPRRTVEVESRLRANNELRPLVEDDVDGHSFLTPVGELIYRAYRDQAPAAAPPTWPPTDPRLAQDKDGMSAVSHHRPPGWARIVARLTEIGFVTRVSYAGQGHGRGAARPSVFQADPATGRIGLLFGDGDTDLPLWVDTTARGDTQLDLVRGWIERNMRRW